MTDKGYCAELSGQQSVAIDPAFRVHFWFFVRGPFVCSIGDV